MKAQIKTLQSKLPDWKLAEITPGTAEAVTLTLLVPEENPKKPKEPADLFDTLRDALAASGLRCRALQLFPSVARDAILAVDTRPLDPPEPESKKPAPAKKEAEKA